MLRFRLLPFEVCFVKIQGQNYFFAVCIPSDAGETCVETKNGTCVAREPKIEDCARYIIAIAATCFNIKRNFLIGKCQTQIVKQRRLSVRERRDLRLIKCLTRRKSKIKANQSLKNLKTKCWMLQKAYLKNAKLCVFNERVCQVEVYEHN